MDVVCVRGKRSEQSDHNNLSMKDAFYCTQFYVKFNKVSIGESSIFTSSSNSNSETILPDVGISDCSSSLTGELCSNALVDKTNIDDSTANVPSVEQTSLLPSDGEWVDVFCNNRICEVNALVGSQHLVHFFDPATHLFVTTPTSSMLQLFHLEKGSNRVICKHRNSGEIKEFFIWLYDVSDRFIVMDIDGTITRSNVTGYFQTVFLGIFSYIHDGLTAFLNTLTQSHGLNVLYLTSRPMTHQKETRSLLEGIAADNGHEMPEGPLFMNKESISQALYREVVTKQSVEYKSGVLAAVAEAFRHAGSPWRTPFTVGIGNTENDAFAYNIAGMHAETILLIDKSSAISVWQHSRDTSSTSIESSQQQQCQRFQSYRDKNLIKFISRIQDINFT